MIKELRKIQRIDRSKAVYIAQLQREGKLKRIINEKGYVCFDTQELVNYKKSVKRGRPANE